MELPDVYDREELYQQVWRQPVTIIALSYGISDAALAKIEKSAVNTKFRYLPPDFVSTVGALVKAAKILKTARTDDRQILRAPWNEACLDTRVSRESLLGDRKKSVPEVGAPLDIIKRYIKQQATTPL